MKANDFVKEYGIDIARECLEERPKTWEICYLKLSNFEFVKYIPSPLDFIDVDDLKRLVESHELVAIHGFEKSKEIVANAPSDNHFFSWTLGGSGVRDKTVNIGELRKAIADVESCM